MAGSVTDNEHSEKAQTNLNTTLIMSQAEASKDGAFQWLPVENNKIMSETFGCTMLTHKWNIMLWDT